MNINFVNLFIVGSGKAGSTSLFDALNKHCDINGSIPKEPMFFASNFKKGVNWYHGLFNDSTFKYNFEASPQYTFLDEFPEASSRIYQYNKNAKILYIVRSPKDRIISHYVHWSRTKPLYYNNINNVLRDDKLSFPLISRTRYLYQIEPYVRLFGSHNVKIIFLEDFSSNYKKQMLEIFDFLELDHSGFSFDKIKSNTSDNVFKEKAMLELDYDLLNNALKKIEVESEEFLNKYNKPEDFWVWR